MLSAVRWGWWVFIWWASAWAGVSGIIEIVEEQQCDDYKFRLTCRDLQTHIAILEAWYTSFDDYRRNYTREVNTNYSMQNMETDIELNRVYLYSSPKHNGIYEPTNHSIFEDSTLAPNDTFQGNDTLINANDTAIDFSIDFVNVSDDCVGASFSRSYASWRESDKKRRRVIREDVSVNLRAPLSYRCTGVNHCNFVLAEDYPMLDPWARGLVFIKYACFDDSVSIHHCNRDVVVPDSGPDSEGYIRSPGYPHFYIGGECRWRLNVSSEQRVRITLLDVSLRSIGPFEEECSDTILIQDSNGEVLLSSCDQVALPMQLTSRTNSLEVIVQVESKGAYPKRGILLHYRSVDCVTLPAPSNGYLVYRNAEVAHYMCNVNHVFVDTRERARLVWCYEDNRWNDTVPFCIEETAIKAVEEDSWDNSTTKDVKLPHTEANMIVDIVIPSVLIAALFIGNALIVLIIYKYRKRKCDDCEDEFNTIPLSLNGNAHAAGNAV